MPDGNGPTAASEVPPSATMSIRQRIEQNEAAVLSPLAARSADAKRLTPEEPSDLRTEFQRDRDRIIHTKSFRRLMHKTQVFISPPGDHVRTRLTHTLEVTQIARTIGRVLSLNEDLIEAIGLGHDLGHTPYGHAGERALAEIYPGFRHNEQSLRIVDRLEKDGAGLNLTDAVRDGILRHSKSRASILGHVSGQPSTLEGRVIKVADAVAYMNHDLDDALRAGIIEASDIPARVITLLGSRHAQRIDTLVHDIVESSDATAGPGRITMSDETRSVADELRDYLFERVYEPINRQPATKYAQRIVYALFEHFRDNVDDIPASASPVEDDPADRRAADYVASMTDRFATELYDRLTGARLMAP